MDELLNEFDVSSRKKFNLHKVVKRLREDYEKFEKGTTELVEYASLQFSGNYSKNCIESWGTYFGPMFFQSFGDGTYCEFPSIQILNKDFLTYWVKRKDKTNNPIMKSRYLGLIYDFSETISNIRSGYNIAIEYIGTLIEFSINDYLSDKGQILNALRRALVVATSFGKNEKAIEIFKYIEQFRATYPEWYGVEFDSINGHKFRKGIPC